MKSFSYLALLSAIAPVALAGIQPQNHYPQTSDAILPNVKPAQDEYDYIIVGSGPGGSPLAANLAIAGFNVLLIDAGGDYGHLREVESPALANPSSERNEVSWGFFTHHYSNETMALKDRKLTYLTPDGKYYSGQKPPQGSKVLGNWYPRYGGLGGCTEHNALVALIASKNDWDNIKNITGDDSWDATAMRKYLKQVEKVGYPLPPDSDPNSHGFDGYIDINVNPSGIPAQDVKLMSVFAGAAKAFGVDNAPVVTALNDVVSVARTDSVDYETGLLPLNLTTELTDAMDKILEWDINNDNPDRDTKRAFARLPQHMDNTAYRRSSPRDYVYNTATAKNADGSRKYKLDVALNTLATKVVFDTHGKKPKAVGVEYLFGQSLYRADPRANSTEDGGEPGSVKATKEVIVAGGAFNSPQLLKLSGIGAKEELKKFNIPVVVDLPGVGENLHDRIETSVNADFPTNFTRILACYYLAADNDPCWAQYVDPNNKGAEKGDYASNGVVMGAFFTSSFSDDGEHDLWIGGFPALFNGFYPGYSSNAATPANKNWWSWLVLKAHTRNNAGTVKLATSNPRDMPIINFHNTYEGQTKEDADKDVGAMMEGMRMAISFFDNIPAIDGTASVFWPPKNVSDSDEGLKEWITEEAWGHHASCSNKIGADDDPMAVLDSKFRVRGVDGLRVVDASAFPAIPGIFPALPIMMLSQKATEDILAICRRAGRKPCYGGPRLNKNVSGLSICRGQVGW
ncbi:GMC oxidoreductase [Xylaria sp. CBS 124048]|nr:GMC oxidoreductase [Xylaria sp. CBS 124048]